VPHDSPSNPRRFVVGVSGASGAVYTRRLVRALLGLGHEIHLTATPPGQRLLHDELGMEGLDVNELAGLPEDADPRDHGVHKYNVRDIGAAIASGSFLHHGMVVCPCSAHTLAAIAAGFGDNLLTRAAAVTLKERRPLILLHREAPLTTIDLDNMRRAADAGAIVCPASPGFYLLPQTIDDLVDFMVGKLLDLLGVGHGLQTRWEGETPTRRLHG